MPTLHYRYQNQDCQFRFGERCRIGRLEENDLCVPDESISRQHVCLAREGNQYVVSDQDSRNGILHDGQRVASLPLTDGTRFQLGDIEFVFRADTPTEAPAETTAASAGPARPPEPTEAETLARFAAARENILAELGKVVIGQREVLAQLLVALFARGHCLLIGVPGLAKTLMAKTLAQCLDLEARRIQFTPDLQPADIVGMDLPEENTATGRRSFRFFRGPLFTNLLLADEINRTPPKTQAALLEAMQEYRVTVGGVLYDLPQPFMLLATQNPIEREGTYPLPEAQLDRFMFCLRLGYPSAEEERRVLAETTRNANAAVETVLDATDVVRFQQWVRQVPVSDRVSSYALNLIRATRPETPEAPECVRRWVRWGAGTRAGQYLLLAAKARVLLEGRNGVACADVREFASPVLRHRLVLDPAAAGDGVSTDDMVAKVVDSVPEPKP